MQRARERLTVTLDGYTRVCLTVIAVLLTVMIVGLWATGPARSAGAQAEPARRPARPARISLLPDSGAQRMVLVKAVETTNRKLDRIISLLQSGKIRVVLVDAKGRKVAANAPKEARK